MLSGKKAIFTSVRLAGSTAWRWLELASTASAKSALYVIVPLVGTPGTVMPGASLVFEYMSVVVGNSRFRIMPPLPLPLDPACKVIAKPTRLLAFHVPGVAVL